MGIDRDVKITVDSEDYNRFFACLDDPVKRLISIADITVKLEAEKEDQQVALACA